MNEGDFEAARLSVRLGAIQANYRTFQRLAGPAAVGAVVKADGYGLGAAMVGASLAALGCDTFFVARLEEGIALRPHVPQARIFVFDGSPPDAVPALITHRLTPVLNSAAQIAGWSAAARETRTEFDAAIHIDTGMNRLGLAGSELAMLAAEQRKQLAGLRVVLWMSHLASAGDPDSGMNSSQLERFRTALAMLPPGPASLASSGGVLLGKDYAFDLVRPGIGLYGGNPQPGRPNPAIPAAILTGRILQLRRVDKGESVGYAATFQAKRPTMLATVALGYADGIPRALSNRGAGAVAGHRAPIAGRVSMDLVSLDVSMLPAKDCFIGAEVEFFGDMISLEDIAASADTNEYEILTGIGARVPRQYVEGVSAQAASRAPRRTARGDGR